MLKIKDDVDLNELEKFELYYNEDNNWYESIDTSKHNYNCTYVFINNNREVWSTGVNDVVYDLIKARSSRKGW